MVLPEKAERQALMDGICAWQSYLLGMYTYLHCQCNVMCRFTTLVSVGLLLAMMNLTGPSHCQTIWVVLGVRGLHAAYRVPPQILLLALLVSSGALCSNGHRASNVSFLWRTHERQSLNPKQNIGLARKALCTSSGISRLGSCRRWSIIW